MRLIERDPSEDYNLVELLGSGRSAFVYHGQHKLNCNSFAIKMIRLYDMKELTILRRIQSSPYIVSLYDATLCAGELCLYMEFCHAGSLSDILELRGHPLTEEESRGVVSSCALGLHHLHSLHIMHRDIKAANILLTREGQVKLSDFGSSAELKPPHTHRSSISGTPFWMAPELIQETSYNGKADIWSLGITILELIEGHPPHFNVHPMRAIFMIPMKPAPRLAEPDKWSKHMNEFVEHCLVKEVSRRWEAKDLLLHDWIKEDVAVVRSGRGIDILRKLVSDNWDAIVLRRRSHKCSLLENDALNISDSSATKHHGRSSPWKKLWAIISGEAFYVLLTSQPRRLSQNV